MAGDGSQVPGTESPASVGIPAASSTAKLVGKHQLVAVLSTVLDFAVMSFFTSVLGFLAYIGTGFGAVAGGLLSFGLGRSWIFGATDGHPGWQGFRYLLVWVVSILLNMGGEYVLVELLFVQYILARVPVAAAVGIFWNYPMHRYFVFRAS